MTPRPTGFYRGRCEVRGICKLLKLTGGQFKNAKIKIKNAIRLRINLRRTRIVESRLRRDSYFDFVFIIGNCAISYIGFHNKFG